MLNELTERAVADIRPHLPEGDHGAEPQLLDIGFSNVVVRFGGTVARIARNDDSARAHLREVATIASLDGRLPVSIPAPCTLLDPSYGLPHGAALQPFLQGAVMTEQDAVERPELAAEIAGLLVALHSLPHASFPTGSLLELDPLPYLERLETQTRRVVDERLTPPERARLATLLSEARRLLPGHPRVVSHADAWYGNMLVDEQLVLTGLLDLENACLADPAFDLAAQTYLDPPSAEAVIAAYEARAGVLENRDARIRGYLLVRELGGLAYAARNDMSEEIDHSMGDLLGLLG